MKETNKGIYRSKRSEVYAKKQSSTKHHYSVVDYENGQELEDLCSIFGLSEMENIKDNFIMQEEYF